MVVSELSSMVYRKKFYQVEFRLETQGGAAIAVGTKVTQTQLDRHKPLKELLCILLFLPVKAEILPEVRIRAKSRGGRKEAIPVTSTEDRTQGLKGSFCDLASHCSGFSCVLALELRLGSCDPRA